MTDRQGVVMARWDSDRPARLPGWLQHLFTRWLHAGNRWTTHHN